jgi:hypothetical protein
LKLINSLLLYLPVQHTQNLLRAVETAKSDARDASRQAQIEARLRSDLAMIRGERDEALGTVSSLKRKLASVEEDLRANRAKLGRVEQEKAKMERDSRAAISLAKTVGTETSCDIDYYKRKVSSPDDTLAISIQSLLFREKLTSDLPSLTGFRAPEPAFGSASPCRGAAGSNQRDALPAGTLHEPESSRSCRQEPQELLNRPASGLDSLVVARIDTAS